MNKIKKIVLCIMILFLCVPVGNVNAEEKEKINIYLFKGDGCPNCENELKFFESIKEEYGSKYNLVEYEVWYNEENSALLEEVAEVLEQEVGGVPYLVIGKKVIIGFDSNTEESIKKTIDEEYNNKEHYDVMDYVGKGKKEESKNNDLVSILIIVGVVIVIGGFVFIARKSTKE